MGGSSGEGVVYIDGHDAPTSVFLKLDVIRSAPVVIGVGVLHTLIDIGDSIVESHRISIKRDSLPFVELGCTPHPCCKHLR